MFEHKPQAEDFMTGANKTPVKQKLLDHEYAELLERRHDRRMQEDTAGAQPVGWDSEQWRKDYKIDSKAEKRYFERGAGTFEKSNDDVI